MEIDKFYVHKIPIFTERFIKILTQYVHKRNNSRKFIKNSKVKPKKNRVLIKFSHVLFKS